MSDRNIPGAGAASPAGAGRQRSRPADAAPRAAALGPLTGHLGYVIRRAQLWIFQDFIRTLTPLEIRPAQYSALLVIEANPGLTQMALSHALAIERARLVHVLNGLEARGLVRRVVSATDRRSHALHLTGDGRKMLARIKALASQHEGHVAERLGVRQHKRLLRLLAPFASG